MKGRNVRRRRLWRRNEQMIQLGRYLGYHMKVLPALERQYDRDTYNHNHKINRAVQKEREKRERAQNRA